MSEEEAEAVRAKNEEIRKSRDEQCEAIAAKFACFKRDFLGAPIRKAMKLVLEKKGDYQACQVDYRKKERFWVTGSADDVTVTLEVQFDNETDNALARVFLMELHSVKKNVMNCPSIVFHDKEFPGEIVKLFPEAIKTRTSSGSISFKVSATHIKKGLDLPLS